MKVCNSWQPLIPQNRFHLERKFWISSPGEFSPPLSLLPVWPLFIKHLCDNQFSQGWSAQAGGDGWEGSAWETAMFPQLLGNTRKCAHCGAPRSRVRPTIGGELSCEAAPLCSSHLPPATIPQGLVTDFPENEIQSWGSKTFFSGLCALVGVTAPKQMQAQDWFKQEPLAFFPPRLPEDIS